VIKGTKIGSEWMVRVVVKEGALKKDESRINFFEKEYSKGGAGSAM
jgi:hypothetical protein